MTQKITEDETVESLFSATFDGLPIGVLLVDADLQVMLINRSAQIILDRGDELTIEQGKLTGSLPILVEKLQQFVKNATSKEAGSFPPEGQALAFPRQDNEIPLEVLVLPPEYMNNALSDVAPRAIVYLFDPVASATGAESILRSLYGLTISEARLANQLAQGVALDDAATYLGISVGTARVHLNKIFTKTGTHRQASLIQRIHVGAAGMALHRQV